MWGFGNINGSKAQEIGSLSTILLPNTNRRGRERCLGLPGLPEMLRIILFGVRPGRQSQFVFLATVSRIFHVVMFRSERARAVPRKPDPGNEYFRSATERSRRKAAIEGRPEASFADGALAAAVFAYAKRVEEEKADTAALRWIMKAASAILAAHPGRSFDTAEAERKVIQRAGVRRKADAGRIRRITKSIELPKALSGGSK